MSPWVSICLVGYAAGYLVLVFTTNRLVMEARISPIAIGGRTVMTKAYALLIPPISKNEHGALTALPSTSRGTGIMLGPIPAGALIWITRGGTFKQVCGFRATGSFCAAATFAGQSLLRRRAQAPAGRDRMRNAISS